MVVVVVTRRVRGVGVGMMNHSVLGDGLLSRLEAGVVEDLVFAKDRCLASGRLENFILDVASLLLDLRHVGGDHGLVCEAGRWGVALRLFEVHWC